MHLAVFMEKIQFELFGLQLLEPMALVMNLFLSVQSLIYYRLVKTRYNTDFSNAFSGFFLFFGISAFFVAWSHLFFNYWGLYGKIPGFTAAIIGICLLECAMLYLLIPKKQTIYLLSIWLIGLVIFALLLYKIDFLWIAVHTGIGIILFVGGTSLRAIVKGNNHYYFLFLGVISMLLTLPIELFNINLHPWFNHQDFSHIFMIITLFCFHKGIEQVTSVH